MALTEPFDVLYWLNSHRGDAPELLESGLSDVLCFSLMWSLFERRACATNANINAICGVATRLYDRGRLTVEDFQPYLAYFRNRYLSEGEETNEKFERLRFRENDRKQTVEDVLKGKLVDPASIVFALLVIVFRLRNNLFHGTKNLFQLPEQGENFAVANRLLATVLDRLL
jgi:hypothetical protein